MDFYIKYWETESDRNEGASEYDNTPGTIQELIHRAQVLHDKGYAAIEVVYGASEKLVYFIGDSYDEGVDTDWEDNSKDFQDV